MDAAMATLTRPFPGAPNRPPVMSQRSSQQSSVGRGGSMHSGAGDPGPLVSHYPTVSRKK